jgi:hypothetical protein
VATSSASLDRSPRSNWVEKSGGLPPGIRKVARKLKHLHPEWSLSRCIATAQSMSEKWAARGSAKGARNVAGMARLRARNKARQVSAATPADSARWLDLAERRVRTPAGVRRFKKPVGALITRTARVPTVRRGADFVRSARKGEATRARRADTAAERLTALDARTRAGVLGKASPAQLAAVEGAFGRRGDRVGRAAVAAERAKRVDSTRSRGTVTGVATPTPNEPRRTAPRLTRAEREAVKAQRTELAREKLGRKIRAASMRQYGQPTHPDPPVGGHPDRPISEGRLVGKAGAAEAPQQAAPGPTVPGQPFPAGPRIADNVAPGMQIQLPGETSPREVLRVVSGANQGEVDIITTDRERHTFGTSERVRVVGGRRLTPGKAEAAGNGGSPSLRGLATLAAGGDQRLAQALEQFADPRTPQADRADAWRRLDEAAQSGNRAPKDRADVLFTLPRQGRGRNLRVDTSRAREELARLDQGDPTHPIVAYSTGATVKVTGDDGGSKNASYTGKITGIGANPRTGQMAVTVEYDSPHITGGGKRVWEKRSQTVRFPAGESPRVEAAEPRPTLNPPESAAEPSRPAEPAPIDLDQVIATPTEASEAKRVTRHTQRYTPEQRATQAASHRLGPRQRQAVGEHFYTHPDVPGRAFSTRGQAARAGLAARRARRG